MENNYYLEGNKQPFKTVASRVRCFTVARPPQNEIKQKIKDAKEKYKRNEIKRNEE